MEITNLTICVVILAAAILIQWIVIFKLHKELKNLTFMMGLVVEVNSDAMMKRMSDKLANITKKVQSRK